MVGIYKYTNKINNKVYIGQSVNIERRIKEHNNRAFTNGNNDFNSLLSRALRKYGLDNFVIEVIEECSKEELDEKEKFYIAQYNSCNPSCGYNLQLGGDSNLGGAGKLTFEELELLTWELKNTTISQKELAIKYNITNQAVSDINVGKYYTRDIEYPIRPRGVKLYCKQCGCEITKDSKSGLCTKCSNASHRKVERPDAITLANEIINSSFVAVGKKYGVSDNAIRKWCVNYGIPTKKQELKEWLVKSTS